MDAELFNDWFHLADLDHNGVVSGQEAVEFFQRSNLSQDTLFQVCHWGAFQMKMMIPDDLKHVGKGNVSAALVYRCHDPQHLRRATAARCLCAHVRHQVWNLVAGDNSSLTKPQFYSTLRLISLAQARACHCRPAVMRGLCDVMHGN